MKLSKLFVLISAVSMIASTAAFADRCQDAATNAVTAAAQSQLGAHHVNILRVNEIATDQEFRIVAEIHHGERTVWDVTTQRVYGHEGHSGNWHHGYCAVTSTTLLHTHY